MAERIVSPGVYTQERDQSFLAPGAPEIGAAFIGPMTKGPAFIPTTVLGIEGLVTTFGEPDGTSYAAYAAKNYLRDASAATVVRVLGWAGDGTGGYSTNAVNIIATGSSGSFVFATLHPNVGVSGIASCSISGTTTEFTLSVTGSGGVLPIRITSMSTVESTSNFITNALGSTPISGSTTPVYVYAVFPTAVTSAGASVTLTASASAFVITDNYKNASTPWIRSQTITGTKYNLFRIHTLTDGVTANDDIKISITGISPSTNPDSEYGTFSLIVRAFNDTDSSPNVLEEWSGLTLDPESTNYIARRIGNSAPTFNSQTNESYYEGDFENMSRYIRVEMSGDVVPAVAVPYGFAALNNVMNITNTNGVSPTYITTRIVGGVDKRYYYGFDFTVTDNLSYLAPRYGSSTVGTEFNLESVTGNEVNQTTPISLTNREHVSYRRFTVPLQGGFDGLNPAREILMGSAITSTNTQGFNLASASTSGSVAFKRALNSLANKDNIQFNLLALPGVIHEHHSYVTTAAIDLCETRQDCFFIMDIADVDSTISTTTALAEALDTNYAAAYYPWVRILDTQTNKLLWTPPSVVLPQVFAFSDRISAPWFAVAGLNRGGIPNAVGVKVRLSQSQRDELYESKVNPIATFPSQGISVWGQKTLQREASALDRINVRRLLIDVKKYISAVGNELVFDPNTEVTRARFLNGVNPYLASIQQRSGLSAFRVVMDETNNTDEMVDRQILYGAVYLQPTRSAEFIKLDFNITNTGVDFDTV